MLHPTGRVIPVIFLIPAWATCVVGVVTSILYGQVQKKLYLGPEQTLAD